MNAKEYEKQMAEVDKTIRQKIKFNLGDRIELNKILIFLSEHCETFDDIGLTNECQSMMNRVVLFKETLNREAQCLEEVERLFGDEKS
jgi:hypothetical protein